MEAKQGGCPTSMEESDIDRIVRQTIEVSEFKQTTEIEPHLLKKQGNDLKNRA